MPLLRIAFVTSVVIAAVPACDSRQPDASGVQQNTLPTRRSAQEVAREVVPSVVVLEMTDANGTPTALGSGFVIKEDLVVTNHHVVAAGRKGSVGQLGEDARHAIVGLAGLDANRDIAILKVEPLRARPLVLRENASVEIGQKVYVVGNPQGLTGTFSEGIVSGLRVEGPDTLIQITAPISPGSSGGPVVDENSTVIGIATATLKGGQNLNFAVPAAYASRALVQAAGKVHPLATARASRRTLKGGFQGPRPAEGVVGAEFVWESSIMLDVIFRSHGSYSLTLRNKLDVPVQNVRVIVVFKSARGEPIEISTPSDGGVIPPQLARRFSGKVDGEVQSLTTPDGSRRPRPGRVEIRILDYHIVQ